jgi:histidinol-phosphate phosphatase family protein
MKKSNYGTTRRKAVFLDRDGTLIEDVGYPRRASEVRLLPEVSESLKSLIASGFILVIVSNQSGVARGLISPEEAQAVHDRVVTLLGEWGILLAGAYYCSHAQEDNCECRKPKPGLILRAAEELSIDLKTSVLVGNQERDTQAASAAGCRSVLVVDNKELVGPVLPGTLCVRTWTDAVRRILAPQEGDS